MHTRAELRMSGLRLKQETYRFCDTDYRIESLLDRQQYDDGDREAQRLGISSATWCLFGQVWPASQVLCTRLCGATLAGKRVLEIGCGLGLASLVLQRRGIDITASDYHPQARGFLERNARLNHLQPVNFLDGNWETENPGLGRFDFIIGSDILYQPQHAEQVSRFVSRHSSVDVDVMVVDPGRENTSRFCAAMHRLGYRHQFDRFDETVASGERCRGRVLRFRRLGDASPDRLDRDNLQPRLPS